MSSRTLKIIASFIVFIAVAGAMKQADATLQNQEIITKIRDKNTQFSALLNAKSDPEDLMKFMHESIDENAEIYLSVNNTDMKQAEALEVKVSKSEYINSYLYGPRQVKNYHVDIMTLKVDVEGEQVKTKEILTETGIIMNLHDYQDKGRDFTSRTTCESQHEIVKGGKLSLTHSKCHTDILYDEAV